jgi:predicted N-acetyltransferase YhbS
MAVVPSHRRRRVASLLMEWGVAKADTLAIEAWMESSPMGKALYEKFGFRQLFKIAYDTSKPNSSDEWRRMEHEMTPTPFYAMWRPANGVWEGSKMPWQLGVQLPN